MIGRYPKANAGARVPAQRSLPLIQYWDEPPWPAAIAGSFVSFSAKNPGLRQLVFDRRSGEELIAQHFGTRELNAFRTCAVPAMRADYFRYCAVLILGGAYVDADIRCISSIRGLLHGLDGGRLFQRTGGIVHSGIFAFTPEHPFLRLTLQAATVNIERQIVDGPKGVWLSTGPGLFTLLNLLHSAGSIDSFLDLLTDQEDGLAIARVLCETVENYSRVIYACRDVRISPVDECRAWIGAPRAPIPHRHGGAHWVNWRGSIFADPPVAH